jgi:hypothetical protein
MFSNTYSNRGISGRLLPVRSRYWAICLAVLLTLLMCPSAFADDHLVSIVSAGATREDSTVAATVQVATVPKSHCTATVSVAVNGSSVERNLPSILTSKTGDGLWQWAIDGKVPAAQWLVRVECVLSDQKQPVGIAKSFYAPAGAGRGTEAGLFVPGSLKASQVIIIKGESGGDGGGARGRYPHDECTWWVATLRPDLPYFPGRSGDALNWIASSQKDHIPTGALPVPGAVAVFTPGKYAYGAGPYGHVAYVLKVNESTHMMRISEYNFLKHGQVDERELSWTGVRFIYGGPAGNGPSPKTSKGGEAGGKTPAETQIAPEPPINTAAPGITGTPKVGKELTCTNGSWSGSPTIVYSYQWSRGGEAISLATINTYTVQSADEGYVLSCVVTATNGAGSTAAPAQGVTAYSLPKNTSRPKITGTPKVGEVMRCMPGAWSGSPIEAFSYKWFRHSSQISGAAGPEYTLIAEDEGQQLSCEVTALNAAGEATAASITEVVYMVPVSTSLPEVVGDAKAGETVSCKPGSWEGVPTPGFTYKWWRGATAILGAVSEAYEVQRADEGHALACEVIAVNSAGRQTAISPAVVVPSLPANVALPQVVGTLKVGATLTCDSGSWEGVPPPSYKDQWLLEGAEIPGATESTYKAVSEDEGELLACKVTATNAAGSTAATSGSVRVSSLPKNTLLPKVAGDATPGDTLSCEPDSWEGTPDPTFAYKWLRGETPISGATKATYEVSAADEGNTLSCEVTATNTAGSTSATSTGVPVPEEARKEKEIITSVDNTKGDLAPYDGEFNTASQKFKALSDRITYAGVTIGNPNLPVGRTSEYKVDIRLCTTPECKGAGSELEGTEAEVNNYGLSAEEFKDEVPVTPGQTYYLVWAPPPTVEGAKWLAFWHAGQSTPIEKSEDLEAIVRGYNSADKGTGASDREIISYLGSKPPPAPYSAPFEYVYQNFIATSNRITILGAVVGNPAAEITKPPVPQELEIRLCTTRTCEGSELAHGEASIVNYGVTEVHLAKAIEVTPGKEYFVYWKKPAEYKATPWVTFWQGTGPEPEDATQVQAVVRGYDAGFETSSPAYFPETPEKNGITTFKDYENASDEGQEIKEGEVVDVTCKIFAPQIPSVEPEGYWYRIHSSPWNEEYYAVAGSFLNGGGIGNPVYTDPKVPDC